MKSLTKALGDAVTPDFGSSLRFQQRVAFTGMHDEFQAARPSPALAARAGVRLRRAQSSQRMGGSWVDGAKRVYEGADLHRVAHLPQSDYLAFVSSIVDPNSAIVSILDRSAHSHSPAVAVDIFIAALAASCTSSQLHASNPTLPSPKAMAVKPVAPDVLNRLVDRCVVHAVVSGDSKCLVRLLECVNTHSLSGKLQAAVGSSSSTGVLSPSPARGVDVTPPPSIHWEGRRLLRVVEALASCGVRMLYAARSAGVVGRLVQAVGVDHSIDPPYAHATGEESEWGCGASRGGGQSLVSGRGFGGEGVSVDMDGRLDPEARSGNPGGASPSFSRRQAPGGVAAATVIRRAALGGLPCDTAVSSLNTQRLFVRLDAALEDVVNWAVKEGDVLAPLNGAGKRDGESVGSHTFSVGSALLRLYVQYRAAVALRLSCDASGVAYSECDYLPQTAFEPVATAHSRRGMGGERSAHGGVVDATLGGEGGGVLPGRSGRPQLSPADWAVYAALRGAGGGCGGSAAGKRKGRVVVRNFELSRTLSALSALNSQRSLKGSTVGASDEGGEGNNVEHFSAIVAASGCRERRVGVGIPQGVVVRVRAIVSACVERGVRVDLATAAMLCAFVDSHTVTRGRARVRAAMAREETASGRRSSTLGGVPLRVSSERDVGAPTQPPRRDPGVTAVRACAFDSDLLQSDNIRATAVARHVPASETNRLASSQAELPIPDRYSGLRKVVARRTLGSASAVGASPRSANTPSSLPPVAASADSDDVTEPLFTSHSGPSEAHVEGVVASELPAGERKREPRLSPFYVPSLSLSVPVVGAVEDSGSFAQLIMSCRLTGSWEAGKAWASHAAAVVQMQSQRIEESVRRWAAEERRGSHPADGCDVGVAISPPFLSALEHLVTAGGASRGRRAESSTEAVTGALMDALTPPAAARPVDAAVCLYAAAAANALPAELVYAAHPAASYAPPRALVQAAAAESLRASQVGAGKGTGLLSSILTLAERSMGTPVKGGASTDLEEQFGSAGATAAAQPSGVYVAVLRWIGSSVHALVGTVGALDVAVTAAMQSSRLSHPSLTARRQRKPAPSGSSLSACTPALAAPSAASALVEWIRRRAALPTVVDTVQLVRARLCDHVAALCASCVDVAALLWRPGDVHAAIEDAASNGVAAHPLFVVPMLTVLGSVGAHDAQRAAIRGIVDEQARAADAEAVRSGEAAARAAVEKLLGSAVGLQFESDKVLDDSSGFDGEGDDSAGDVSASQPSLAHAVGSPRQLATAAAVSGLSAALHHAAGGLVASIHSALSSATALGTSRAGGLPLSVMDAAWQVVLWDHVVPSLGPDLSSTPRFGVKGERGGPRDRLEPLLLAFHAAYRAASVSSVPVFIDGLYAARADWGGHRRCRPLDMEAEAAVAEGYDLSLLHSGGRRGGVSLRGTRKRTISSYRAGTGRAGGRRARVLRGGVVGASSSSLEAAAAAASLAKGSLEGEGVSSSRVSDVDTMAALTGGSRGVAAQLLGGVEEVGWSAMVNRLAREGSGFIFVVLAATCAARRYHDRDVLMGAIIDTVVATSVHGGGTAPSHLSLPGQGVADTLGVGSLIGAADSRLFTGPTTALGPLAEAIPARAARELLLSYYLSPPARNVAVTSGDPALSTPPADTVALWVEIICSKPPAEVGVALPLPLAATVLRAAMSQSLSEVVPDDTASPCERILTAFEGSGILPGSQRLHRAVLMRFIWNFQPNLTLRWVLLMEQRWSVPLHPSTWYAVVFLVSRLVSIGYTRSASQEGALFAALREAEKEGHGARRKARSTGLRHVTPEAEVANPAHAPAGQEDEEADNEVDAMDVERESVGTASDFEHLCSDAFWTLPLDRRWSIPPSLLAVLVNVLCTLGKKSLVEKYAAHVKDRRLGKHMTAYYYRGLVSFYASAGLAKDAEDVIRDARESEAVVLRSHMATLLRRKGFDALVQSQNIAKLARAVGVEWHDTDAVQAYERSIRRGSIPGTLSKPASTALAAAGRAPAPAVQVPSSFLPRHASVKSVEEASNAHGRGSKPGSRTVVDETLASSEVAASVPPPFQFGAQSSASWHSVLRAASKAQQRKGGLAKGGPRGINGARGERYGGGRLFSAGESGGVAV